MGGSGMARLNNMLMQMRSEPSLLTSRDTSMLLFNWPCPHYLFAPNHCSMLKLVLVRTLEQSIS